MQTPFLFRHAEIAVSARALEKRSAGYTKPKITELILDMAGYDAGSDLTEKFADAFASGVSAYPAVTVIPKGNQHLAVVASVGRDAPVSTQQEAGKVDAGIRAAVTGGQHMEALETLIVNVLISAGLTGLDIKVKSEPAHHGVEDRRRPNKRLKRACVSHRTSTTTLLEEGEAAD